VISRILNFCIQFRYAFLISIYGYMCGVGGRSKMNMRFLKHIYRGVIFFEEV